MIAYLRRTLLSRIVFNLAAVLGLAQLLVLHWAWVVMLRAEGPSPGWLLAAAVAFALGNALAVPAIVRARTRSDAWGRVARFYSDLGVATLPIAVAIASSWALVVLAAGLLGALGASPSSALPPLRGMSLALAGAAALVVSWGFTGGQARVERTRHRVPIPGLAPELAGLRIAQISDLHIGNKLAGRRLERYVDLVNAAEPDVLVLTGDLFDFDPAVLDEGARALGRLHAGHGVYGVLGNHDVYVGAERVAAALARHAPKLRLLRDEIVRLPTPRPLYLAGVDDPGQRWFVRRLHYPALEALSAQRPADGPVLLLVHQPEAFAQAASLGFPLVLSGHTHGGQLALPVQRGQLNVARMMTPYSRGAYQHGATRLYVNRGLGVGGPALRLFCDREIATFELEPAV